MKVQKPCPFCAKKRRQRPFLLPAGKPSQRLEGTPSPSKPKCSGTCGGLQAARSSCPAGAEGACFAACFFKTAFTPLRKWDGVDVPRAYGRVSHCGAYQPCSSSWYCSTATPAWANSSSANGSGYPCSYTTRAMPALMSIFAHCPQGWCVQ